MSYEEALDALTSLGLNEHAETAAGVFLDEGVAKLRSAGMLATASLSVAMNLTNSLIALKVWH